MSTALLKGAGLWLLLVAVAIANGLLREEILAPLFGAPAALALSGLLLSGLVFVVALVTLPAIGRTRARVYWAIGLVWTVLTLGFEFLSGHYLAGKSWAELVQIFNPVRGDLFLLVLAATACSPWLAARLRGWLP